MTSLNDWQTCSGKLKRDLHTYSLAVRCDGLWLLFWGIFAHGIIDLMLKTAEASIAKRVMTCGVFSYMVISPVNRYKNRFRSELILRDDVAGIQIKLWHPNGWMSSERFDTVNSRYAIRVTLFPNFFQRHGGDIMGAYAELRLRLQPILTVKHERVQRADVAVDVGGLALADFLPLTYSGCLHNKLTRKPARTTSDNTILGTAANPAGCYHGDSWDAALVIYDKLAQMKKFEKDAEEFKHYMQRHGQDLRRLTRFEFRLGQKLNDFVAKGTRCRVEDYLTNMQQVYTAVFLKASLLDQPYNIKNPSRNTISPLWLKMRAEVLAWASTQTWDPAKLTQVNVSPLLPTPKRPAHPPSTEAFTKAIERSIQKLGQKLSLPVNDPYVRTAILHRVIHGGELSTLAIMADVATNKKRRQDEIDFENHLHNGAFKPRFLARRARVEIDDLGETA